MTTEPPPMPLSGEEAATLSALDLETAPQPPAPPLKKKRNLPGMPDPDAEVIALSPKTLLATNRFVCEICNKGFQRDQNLQLHRRGHNLPWKLRQRATKEVRKRVYVCPEPSCVHHNPSRALGDLTGIKKHFCRKHGEKKLKCERCSKKYAVQSDWKAHMKTCGTREYRCGCGTLFSRRDSFVTHRAFCDALAEESAKAQTLSTDDKDGVGAGAGAGVTAASSSSPPQPPLTPSTSVVSPTLSIQSSEIPENATRLSPPTTCVAKAVTTSTVLATVLASSAGAAAPSTTSFPNVTAATSLSLSVPLYLSNNVNDPRHHYTACPQPSTTAALSATALLQKAAQMGAASSNTSLLRGLGLATSSTGYHPQDESGIENPIMQWNMSSHVKQENPSLADHNLGLGLPCGDPGFADVMMGSPPMTRDLLGLGIGGNGGDNVSRGGLSALLTSFGGNFDSSGDAGGVRHQ
ncbi:hypothetical protein HN51_052165 [Arachis hypogaea]|uniref:C2H2-type domain-containing protein n=1 Tax=Arachis hypogaea TaxID=3818 RepID=A0A445CBQ9_ARAHY|nr:protein indeterminate-domain 1 [Arachis ipaensis]XP_025666419.1 zinc finger protein ENHYDROUS [Arachis hypogaea]QHN93450.1 Protein indeterminate-domain [Arachis hypogaea]RYR48407.1 hypothetical protein Ahy_A07g034430 isoform B [Arachis hypogaea]